MRFPEFSGEWEKYKLDEIATISKERIGVGMLSSSNYISTENMKSNFGGVDLTASLPVSGNVIKFQQGDTLLSNIRPYLKKIWQARFDGGCSADILVFRSNKLCNQDFLYYTLANEKFISYAMSGAKGVKMPRGDKEQLLKYELHLPTATEQNKITSLLSLLDQRIKTQKKVIEDLKRLKYAISKRVFENHGSSNSMLLGKVADIYQPQTIPTSWLNDALQYPVYGANGVIGKYSEYNHENSQICIACRGNTCGTVNYSEPKSWITGNAMVINTDRYDVNKRFLFHQLCIVNYSTIISGSGQPQIVRAPLEKMKIWFPDEDVQERIATFFDTIEERVLIEETTLILAERMKQYLLSRLFI